MDGVIFIFGRHRKLIGRAPDIGVCICMCVASLLVAALACSQRGGVIIIEGWYSGGGEDHIKFGWADGFFVRQCMPCTIMPHRSISVQGSAKAL